MNHDNLTRKQIQAMQTEAGTASDDAMVDICERALDGDPIALRAVADAIANAKAMDDTARNYSLAFVKADGSFDIVETFAASSNEAANEWAENHYADKEWYVLDNTGRNINGGAQ